MSIDTNAQLPNKPTGFAGGLLWGLGELLLIPEGTPVPRSARLAGPPGA